MPITLNVNKGHQVPRVDGGISLHQVLMLNCPKTPYTDSTLGTEHADGDRKSVPWEVSESPALAREEYFRINNLEDSKRVQEPTISVVLFQLAGDVHDSDV